MPGIHHVILGFVHVERGNFGMAGYCKLRRQLDLYIFSTKKDSDVSCVIVSISANSLLWVARSIASGIDSPGFLSTTWPK